MALLLNKRYELLETLGEGGEGRVVKALDHQHERLVALKIRQIRGDRARAELLSEARVLLAVTPHPALPLVREDFFDGDTYVVAMDWVDGTDLARLLTERGRRGLAPSSVLTYLAQAAEALTHLHGHAPPVIHGDIKPANLILTKGGSIKLVDFGLSSTTVGPARRAGTPGFRAPELASAGAPSRASDVYALAATAFALLTGSPPSGLLPSWDGIDSEQAQQLEGAIRLGLATDPSQRPSTPGELVERLRAGWGAALPSGVMTFCLSDIEGSTAMWDTSPVAMADALVRHDELIAERVEAQGGRFLKSMGEGDATVSVFDSAPAALEAAVSITTALAGESWPDGIDIAVRFGIHTGEAERRDADYFGPTLNLAARLRGQADGGEIFLSSTTAAVAAEHLPDGCDLVDLGPHRLRGLAQPEHIRALRGPGVAAPPPVTDCPYRGLLAFQPDDRAFFFGREAVVEDLARRVAASGFVALVGASGSGKSSVLRAGLVAAALAGELDGVERAGVITPGATPELTAGDDPAELVVVDQFEELFTLCDDAELRARFVDGLLALPGPVVIGVRADFYGQLSTHPGLAQAVADSQILLGAMTAAELGRAVTEPARLAGLRLEPGLVELVLRDVGREPGALPLMSHALRATWERRDGRSLTVEGYRESGGVASAVARTADALVESLPPDRRQLTRSLFVRLTELGEGTDDTRRRVAVEELQPEGAPDGPVRELLEQLAQARLVTLGEGTAEVAHEVLIREWPTLRGWLDEDREGLRLHRQLGNAARLWDAGGREASDLYRGARLAGAQEWGQAHPGALNATEHDFLERSHEAGERDAVRQRRANRRLRALLAGTALFLLVALVAGAVALVQRGRARTAKTGAEAQALTSDAERLGAQALTETRLDRSMLVAVAGVDLADLRQTRGALLANMQKNPGALGLMRPSRSAISAVAVAPGGRTLAVGDSAGAVRFTDLRTFRSTGAAVTLAGPVAAGAMRFSPDGRKLAVATGQGDRESLYLIDTGSRRAARIASWRGLVPPPPSNTASIAYSPDGRRIAVALPVASLASFTPVSERLALVDASTGRVAWVRRYPVRRGQREARVEFSPNGQIVTSAQQGATLVWRPRDGRIVRRFPIGGQPAISADGRQLALARNSPSPAVQSSSVVLLDLRSGARRALHATVPSAWVNSLAFTPDGRRIVGDAFDGNLRVWNAVTGAAEETFAVGAGGWAEMTLDPSGRTLLAGSQDGSVAAWDLGGSRRLGRSFQWGLPEDSCPATPCLVVNRQSTLMASDQGDDGTVSLVDLRTLRPVKTLPARNGLVANALAFFPDGRTLATGGINGQVTLWDVRTAKVVRSLAVGAPVWWTAVSPDGKLLAVQTQAEGSPGSRVEVRSLPSGRVLRSHSLRDGYGGLFYSADGRTLVALGCCKPESTVAAWDAHSGATLFQRRLSDHVTAIALSPRSHLLGVGTEDGRLLLWGARDGRRRQPPIQVAAGRVDQISFSPDGRRFAVGSNDQTATLWDLRSRTRIGNSFPVEKGVIPAPLFEPNGQLLIDYLANASEWPTDTRSWRRYACRVAGRGLSRAEWRELLPNRPYRRLCST